jgi:hypothetical protein
MHIDMRLHAQQQEAASILGKFAIPVRGSTSVAYNTVATSDDIA